VKQTDDESDVWIPALEAAHLIATQFGGLTRAQHALALALREGLLDAGAQEAAVSTELDADFEEEVAEDGELLCIPRKHWSRSEFWDSDRLRWDWESGDFEIHNTETGETYLFDGVFFLEVQVRKLDPSLPVFATLDPDATPSPGAKRGPKTKVNRWGAFVGALLELERNNELRVSDHESVASLVEAVQREIPDPSLWLDQRTMEGVLSYVWHNHLEGLPPRNRRN
jgi:hypothetical protein